MQTVTQNKTPARLVFARATKTSLGDWAATVTESGAPSGHRIPAIVYGRTLEDASERAALFCAAPDLLVACRWALRAIEDRHASEVVRRNALDSLHVAIALAEATA